MALMSWALKSSPKDESDCHNFSSAQWVLIGLFTALFSSDIAYAQFGGKSGAPSGSVVASDYNFSVEDRSVSENSALEVLPSSSGSNSTSNDEAKDKPEGSNYTSARIVSTTSKNTLFDRRQRYFIKKFRLEFAARETVERAAGIAASWTRVNSYLRDLDDELLAVEQSGEEASGTFITGMARDLNLVETTLDDQIDEVLLIFEKNFSKGASYVITPLLPQSSAGLRAKMRALAEKSELVDFSTKALQAMGYWQIK
ncbi:hypothetical protein N8500_09745 [Candidatus Puniceispirillum sp.]|nr:hypothetical protein [Candidatus Puniceispirillum sp.]